MKFLYQGYGEVNCNGRYGSRVEPKRAAAMTNTVARRLKSCQVSPL